MQAEHQHDFVGLCMNGPVERVREALGRGRDVNSRWINGDTGLMRAAIRGREEAVEVLVAQPGVDVNCRSSLGDTALHLAYKY